MNKNFLPGAVLFIITFVLSNFAFLGQVKAVNDNSDTFYGDGAGSNCTGCLNDSWFGASALLSNDTGEFNTAIGTAALSANTTGDRNTASGFAALFFNNSGMNIVPVEKSALFGPMMIEVLTRVAALTAERDRAIASLQAILDKPYAGPLATNPPITPALLSLDPMFDSLRADPRFQRMINSH
jgi:hypothetical protein